MLWVDVFVVLVVLFLLAIIVSDIVWRIGDVNSKNTSTQPRLLLLPAPARETNKRY